jgi:hypothetical protein
LPHCVIVPHLETDRVLRRLGIVPISFSGRAIFERTLTMAKAARGKTASKRSTSPIGRKGPRKANPKYKRNNREPWTAADVRTLKQLAKANTPTGVISLKMGRTEIAIRGKAQREGISLAPTNRSPYNRRKTTAASRKSTARKPAARAAASRRKSAKR